jgi:hypothetical protein
MGTAAAAAGPLSAVSPIMSIASGFMKGQGDEAAADYQANKLRVSAEYARGAAKETDAQMRENLNLQLQNIDAVRAAANIDPTSPTTAALKDRTAMIGDRSRSIQVGNIMAQAAQNEADANYTEQAGKFAYSMDILGGATNAAGTLSKTKWG